MFCFFSTDQRFGPEPKFDVEEEVTYVEQTPTEQTVYQKYEDTNWNQRHFPQ